MTAILQLKQIILAVGFLLKTTPYTQGFIMNMKNQNEESVYPL
jgi:hypothetical protein